MSQARPTRWRPIRLLAAAAAVLALFAVAVVAVDAADDRGASSVTHLGALTADYRLTPLRLRRLGAVGGDFGVTGAGAVLLSAPGGYAEINPAGRLNRRGLGEPAIQSLAVDEGARMLTVGGGYFGAVTDDPAARRGLVLPYPDARLAPSVRPGAVYMFGGRDGHFRLYRITEAGEVKILLDANQPIVGASDTAGRVYAATGRKIVRLTPSGTELVFQAPDDPHWGPIVSIAAATDSLLFFATPSRVYATLNGQAVSIVNDSGGALRLAGGTLYVLDRRRGLLYGLSPASTAMFGGAAP